ncbi:MAG TPA: PP2C family protein-serine/threonine phosphatase [Fluviicola sp.]|nr:PP2C family protein-serine/threonine phosphatase [Fluviicola sp.]
MITEAQIANLETQIEWGEYRLNSLLELSRAISTNQTTEQIVKLFEFVMKEQLGYDRFLLVKKDKEWFTLLKTGLKHKVREISFEKEFARFKDITMIESSYSPIINEFDIVIPVFHQDLPLAYLLISGIDHGSMKLSKTLSDLSFVQTLTNMVVMAVENERMTREELRRERLKKELEVASEMQKLLFPSDLPSNKQMDVSAKYIPRHEVGGDYYDFISLGNDEYAICIADVSGKGISAAMLMANFQATVRTFFSTVYQIKPFSLEFLIEELNKKVMLSAKGEKFITFFIAVYHAKTRELKYINAGHNQPIITNGKQYKLLHTGCVGLGMFDQMPFIQKGEEVLAKNSTLILYTDGVVELENEKDEHFELERLIKIYHNFYRLSMEDMNNIVFSKLDEWKGKRKLVDDTAIFSCRFF